MSGSGGTDSNLLSIGALTQFLGGTQAVWNSISLPIPQGLVVYATDTTAIKIGNGTSLYSELPVAFNLNTILDIVNQSNTNATSIATLTPEVSTLQTAVASIISQLVTLNAAVSNAVQSPSTALTPNPSTKLVAYNGTSLGYVEVNQLSLGGGLTSLGGDLSGTPTAAEIVSIDGVPINATGAVVGDSLVFDGTTFVPTAGPTIDDGGFF